MMYRNSTVSSGRGKGIVVATGMSTEIGKIAESVQGNAGVASKELGKESDSCATMKSAKLRVQAMVRKVKEKNIAVTPLQRSMNGMMFLLLLVAIVLAIIVFAVHDFQVSINHGVGKTVLLYAIGVAVAILPEGLPAVVTVTMAFGVRKMATRKAIVRRLASLEAVGQVTNICSDKTGTLTQGKMVAVDAWIGERAYTISGEGVVPEGHLSALNENRTTDRELTTDDIKRHPVLSMAMTICALCNTSTLRKDGQGVWVATGTPTEVALMVLSRKAGLDTSHVKSSFEFVSELSFDPALKIMTMVYRRKVETKPDSPKKAASHQVWYFAKGTVEAIYAKCTQVLLPDGSTKPLPANYFARVELNMTRLGSKGLRVLALAYKQREFDTSLEDVHSEHDISRRNQLENAFTFVGLVGIYDPPRKETKGAIVVCKRAGIQVHMATGDHPCTAEAIAREVSFSCTQCLPYS
jgi:potassium/sodium efflux P-type ATPase